MAQLIAGKPVEHWPGGIAPGASIFSARVYPSDEEFEAYIEEQMASSHIMDTYEAEASKIKLINADMIAAECASKTTHGAIRVLECGQIQRSRICSRTHTVTL